MTDTIDWKAQAEAAEKMITMTEAQVKLACEQRDRAWAELDRVREHLHDYASLMTPLGHSEPVVAIRVRDIKAIIDGEQEASDG